MTRESNPPPPSIRPNPPATLPPSPYNKEKRMNTMSTYRQLDDLQEKQWNWVEQQGWHNKTRLECLALITSEVGEAINEARGEDVKEAYYLELADIGLRLLDLAEEEGISLQEYIEKKMEMNLQRTFGKDKVK